MYNFGAAGSRTELFFSDNGPENIDAIINSSFDIFKNIFGAAP